MNANAMARRRRTKAAAIVLCCLAVVLPTASHGPFDAPGIAMAAEKDEESETGDPAKDAPGESEASENSEDGSPGDEPAKTDTDESAEIFVPSEDISEDIDVPFPVDI